MSSRAYEQVAEWASLVQAKAARVDRYMIGIAGAPGSGKSTLAEQLRVACAPRAAVLALDGFHMTNAVLDAAGHRHRKGAPETFDAASFASTVASLRRRELVHAPIYDRRTHEPRPHAVTIDPAIALIIVEGNYLLLDASPWREARSLLDEVWYLATPPEECTRRVRARHIAGGSSPTEADRKIEINDRPNAAQVEATRHRADRIVELS